MKKSENSFADNESDVLLSFMYNKNKYKNCNVNKYENYTLGIIINPENPRYNNPNIRKA